MSPKILIIDDDVDLVEVIRLTLESHGLQVIDAQDGATGLEMIKKEKPDLIILDVMMETVYEGFELAQQIRSTKTIADIPIIMLTAVSQETGFKYDKEEGILPVDEFIEKPVMPEHLTQIVKKYTNSNSQ